MLLRQNKPRAARGRFLHAIGTDTVDADAWYGFGLALARLNDRTKAVKAWRQTLTLAPAYGDAELQILALGIDSGLALPAVLPPLAPDVPARTAGDGFEVRAAGGGWQPFYVKGINIGVALPGHFPTEFPSDDSTYAHWLELIAGARANAVRVYTILPPAFYRALRTWNVAHPDNELWLLQGVWTELPPRHDYDAADWKGAFRAEMRRAVDVVHGHALVAARRGHAFGRFDADVSDHVLGFIIGREWEPFSITAHNARRRHTTFSGRFLAVDHGTPADVWMAEQCDYLLGYEWDTYHAQRPIAYTNWPTLDPLSHATEPTLDEEQRLRRLHGFPPNPRLKEYDNDRESLDAMLVRTTPADLGGYFASYHVYPYYPDFIGLDSIYGAGQTHYLGYLRDLKRHHAGRPLLVAEYGVPSSRGVSHRDPDGRDHGGHDEREMGEIDARLTREIRDAGAAGGILFSWLDEWFKRTWVTIDLEVPAERTRLWHNMEDAEQNYGLLGEYAGPASGTPEPGGDTRAWETLDVVGRGGRARDSLTLRVGSDPSYLYLALSGGPSGGLDAVRYVVGIDTYRRDRGQFRLPGVARPGAVGYEFALVLSDTSDAELRVAPWYNPYLGPRKGMGPTGLDPFYNEAGTVDVARRDGAFDSLFVATNRWRIGRDARTYPVKGVNRGRLRYGRATESTLSDWYVDRASGLIEIRIPWGVLNVTDPSSRRVMVRYRGERGGGGGGGGVFETARTDGFRFACVALDRGSGASVARIEPERIYAWPTWEEPTWHERLKPAYNAMREVWGSW